MATGTASHLKDQYQNTTSGWVGVCIKNGKGDLEGIAVSAGDSVWMDEDERVATANAPRDPADNPFVNGSLVKTASGQDVRTHRPIDGPDAEAAAPVVEEEPPPAGPGVAIEERPPAPPEEEPDVPAPGEEAGGAPQPARPAQGVRPAAEEVGSPQAPAQAAESAQARAPDRGK